MFGHDHYVPVLKAKEGEYGALHTLPSASRKAMTPLLEIPPIDWDYELERPKKTIDQHLEKVGQKIQRAWGGDGHVFVDLPLWIPANERMSDGRHPLEYVFASLRAHGIQGVPVMDVLRPNDYLSTCSDIIAEDQRGVCLRIHRDDFLESDDIGATIIVALEKVGANIGHTDLVIDLKGLTSDQPLNPTSLIDLLNRLPALNQWRTFTLAGTSFPRNLTGLPPSEFSYLPRDEWNLWKNLVRSDVRFDRLPTFGDYGISSSEPSEVDPRIIRPSASIRYTHDTYWLVSKGRNLRDHGFDQFHDVCRALIQRPEYAGQQFSWGDEYIYECAARRCGPGNLSTWRKVGTSHHLAFVVRQLATEVGS